MKVLFLDVDGVLNSSRSVLSQTGASSVLASLSQQALKDIYPDGLSYMQRYTLETIDPVAVDLVNRLLNKSEAVLVLSTSHRQMFVENGVEFGSERHLQLLGLYFNAMGIKAPIYSITPQLHGKRGTEIQRWLENQKQEITNYVILDDSKDFESSQPLVWCDPCVGFNAENYFTASKELDVDYCSLLLP